MCGLLYLRRTNEAVRRLLAVFRDRGSDMAALQRLHEFLGELSWERRRPVCGEEEAVAEGDMLPITLN